MEKLRKQSYYINHENIKTNNGNEKHPKKDKGSYNMICYGMNFYRSFRKQFSDYRIFPLSFGTDLH